LIWDRQRANAIGPDERIQARVDCMLLKPGQKITGVGGNQAGINTRLVPFFSSSSYSVSVDL